MSCTRTPHKFADHDNRDYIFYDSLTDRSPRMEATAISLV
nr:MAG TPA: hypothetical protein [Caudoviricetes sp.]